MSVLFIFNCIFLRHAKQSQFIPLQNVVYFITLPVLVRKIFTFYINDVLLFKCPIRGPRDYAQGHFHGKKYDACFAVNMSRYNSVGTVTSRRASRLKNRSSFPGSDKRFLSVSKRPDRL